MHTYLYIYKYMHIIAPPRPNFCNFPNFPNFCYSLQAETNSVPKMEVSFYSFVYSFWQGFRITICQLS